MPEKASDNIKLGSFVIAGLAFLILMLYMIGKNKNMFSSVFPLKARFENVQGLKEGNNVRYAGIEVGTVDEIAILSDSSIEVTMMVQTKMKKFIRKNAHASIGRDGLVGNKVVNITATAGEALLVDDNDVLPIHKSIDTDDMLRVLSKTNIDVGTLTEKLKLTVDKLNTSTALWHLLTDESIPLNLRRSAINVRVATARASEFTDGLNRLINDVQNGNGSLGTFLKDTTATKTLNEALVKIRSAGSEADSLGKHLNSFATNFQNKVENGEGIMNALLTDPGMVASVNNSLENIENATISFNKIMEALKHNFLVRGYIRKMEQKEADRNDKTVENSKTLDPVNAKVNQR